MQFQIECLLGLGPNEIVPITPKYHKVNCDDGARGVSLIFTDMVPWSVDQIND